MTLKQFARQEFFDALDQYREAQDRTEFVAASLRLHIAAGSVPTRFRRYVTKAYKEKRITLTTKEN